MSRRNEKKTRQEEEKLSLYAKNFLKSEMGRKLIKVGDLAKKLEDDPLIVGNKIGRGKFSAGFFLQALRAIGTQEITIPTESKEQYDFAAE